MFIGASGAEPSGSLRRLNQSATNQGSVRLSPLKTMTDPDRPRDVDESALPILRSVLSAAAVRRRRTVWLVCGRCGLRWSIRERRVESSAEYRGFERRRPLFG